MQQRPITAESVKVDSTGLNLACRSNLIHSHADLKLSRKIWRRQFGVKPLDAVYDLCAKCQLLLRLRVGGGVEPNFAGKTRVVTVNLTGEISVTGEISKFHRCHR